MKETTRTESYRDLRYEDPKDNLDTIVKENFYCPQCKRSHLNIYVNWLIIYWGIWCEHWKPWVCSKCSTKNLLNSINNQ